MDSGARGAASPSHRGTPAPRDAATRCAIDHPGPRGWSFAP
jgi:hypothetical protein